MPGRISGQNWEVLPEQILRAEQSMAMLPKTSYSGSLGTDAPIVLDQAIPTPTFGCQSCCGGKRRSPRTDLVWFKQHRELVLVGFCGFFLLIAWVGEAFAHWGYWWSLTFYVLSYLAGGADITRTAVPALFRAKFDTDILMLAAAAGAAILGKWAEGAFLLFLFSLGHAGEHYAMDRARSAIDALAKMMPDKAWVKTDQGLVERHVGSLTIGEVVLVRPGDRVPTDGQVFAGSSALDESPITGESVPVDRGPGDNVFAGTINLESALDVEVTKLAKDNTLVRVMEMVAEAQERKSPTQNFTQKFTSRFVPAVLILTFCVAVVPPFFELMSFRDSFYRSMLLLVAASPCALALGTPAAVLAAIGRAARKGVLIKGGAHLENLGSVKVMAFDKTGTLTEGQFHVTESYLEEGIAEHEFWALVGAVEQTSNHPLAQAVVREVENRGVSLASMEESVNVPGKGVEGIYLGQSARVGSLKLFEGPGTPPLTDSLKERVRLLEESGSTVMIASLGNKIYGTLALRDTPRSTAKATLSKLRALGVDHLVMLTGDNSRVAGNVANELGLTDVRASLLPAQKVGAVRELQHKYGLLAMTGDGVNDAPALATSDVGIAMGGAGTAVALETADVALMGDDLSKLPFAVGLSRLSHKIIRQNVAIALGVIIMLVLTSVTGLIDLGIAVVFHEGSTVLVIMNALRLLNYQLE